MITINVDKLSSGLYQVHDGRIHKYKAYVYGGKVRTYEIGEIVRCKDCKYAKLFEDRDGLCGHPSNNAWDIWDEFYCGRGVKHELVE